MMKSLYTFILLLCFCGICLSQQEVPQALYNAIYSYLNDGTSVKRNIRGLGLDTTIQVSEITIEKPVEIYQFKICDKAYCFENNNIDTTVESLIESTGYWEFSLKARGKYLYIVKFYYKNGKCDWVSSGGNLNSWSEVKLEYPESTGIQPILIKNSGNYYLHFPQLSNHNLTLLTDRIHRAQVKKQISELRNKKEGTSNEYKNKIENELDSHEGLLSTMTDSYKNLVDSRIVLSYLKNQKKWESKWPEMKRGVK